MRVTVDLRRKTVTVESSIDEQVKVLDQKDIKAMADGEHIICPDCGKPFATEPGMRMHRTKIHKKGEEKD
jgi:hypothetical protein